jgi:hypothetical protein
MSRWGKPRKNVKRIDPRYFMDEKTDVISESKEDIEEIAGVGSSTPSPTARRTPRLQTREPDMTQAQELAQALSQSPAVMAAVQQAAKDPEVQAAAQEGAIQEGDFMPTNQQLSDTAMATGIGGGAIMAIGAAAVATPAVFALGLTGGVALMAIGILVSQIVEQ